MTPGQGERAQAELAQADEALNGARFLLGNGDRAGAASRMYYAVFHAARAALILHGHYAKTHSGQITLFRQFFGPAPILEQLFKLRGEADYAEGPFTTTVEELQGRADEAAQFVERCRRVVADGLTSGPDEPDPPPDL